MSATILSHLLADISIKYCDEDADASVEPEDDLPPPGLRAGPYTCAPHRGSRTLAPRHSRSMVHNAARSNASCDPLHPGSRPLRAPGGGLLLQGRSGPPADPGPQSAHPARLSLAPAPACAGAGAVSELFCAPQRVRKTAHDSRFDRWNDHVPSSGGPGCRGDDFGRPCRGLLRLAGRGALVPRLHMSGGAG